MSANAFRVEIDKWFQEQVEDRIILLTRMIGLEALKRVIEKSPVDEGRFKGNWQVTIAAPATGTVDRLDRDGSATLAEGSAVIGGLTEAKAIWLVNNLPYASRLENGWSKQAPAGVVAVTIAELEAHFARAR